MKKVVFLIITLLMCLTLTSCDDTIAYNGGVDVTIPDEIVEKLVHDGMFYDLYKIHEKYGTYPEIIVKGKYIYNKGN